MVSQGGGASGRDDGLIINQTGGVMNQMPDGDVVPVFREIGEDVRQRRTEIQEPQLMQQHHRHRGELFRHRGNPVVGHVTAGNPGFQVRQPEGLFVNKLTLPDDRDTRTGGFRQTVFLEQGFDERNHMTILTQVIRLREENKKKSMIEINHGEYRVV